MLTMANRIRWLKLWNTAKTTGDDRTFVSDFNLHDDIAIAHNMYNTYIYTVYICIYICVCVGTKRGSDYNFRHDIHDNWPDYPLAMKHGNGKSTNLDDIVSLPEGILNHIITYRTTIYIYTIKSYTYHIHIIYISYRIYIYMHITYTTMIYRL